MELILILLGSFLFGPFILAAAAAAELFVATVGVLLDMAFARRAKRASGPPPVPSVWPKRLFYTGSGLALVTFLLVAIVNWFWFAGFVRWSLDRIETRSGVRVAYESVEGSMWTGELRLKNASIVKSDGERLRCDLQVQRVDVDVAVLSLLSPSVRVERLVIDQPVGTIRWPSSKKSDRERRARRSFEISEMEILGMDLQLQRGKGKVYRLQVPEWRSAPLRSGWLPFDVLFRTNCKGTVAGADFAIRSTKEAEGRHTYWKANGLPAWFLTDKLGPKFKLLGRGEFDLEVDDRWSLARVAEVDSRWKVTYRVAQPKSRILRKAVGKVGSKTFEFRVTLDANGLRLQRTSDHPGFWGRIGKALLGKILGKGR